MYTIANVIYGLPLTKKVSDLINQWEEDENSPWFEDNHGPCGFRTFYDGNADQHKGYCGVEIKSLDTIDSQLVTDWAASITKNQKGQAKAAIKQLHPDILACYDEEEPQPRCWIIWSTS